MSCIARGVGLVAMRLALRRSGASNSEKISLDPSISESIRLDPAWARADSSLRGPVAICDRNALRALVVFGGPTPLQRST